MHCIRYYIRQHHVHVLYCTYISVMTWIVRHTMMMWAVLWCGDGWMYVSLNTVVMPCKDSCLKYLTAPLWCDRSHVMMLILMGLMRDDDDDECDVLTWTWWTSSSHDCAYMWIENGDDGDGDGDDIAWKCLLTVNQKYMITFYNIKQNI